MPIQDVALKTYRERCTIEKDGGRGSERSTLEVRHDDDDDDDDHTWRRTPTQTHKHTEYTLVKKKEKERNNFCGDESLSRTINLNWTFTDINNRIKKKFNPIKTVTSQKTKGNINTNNLLPEDSLKRQQHVLKKNK